MQNLQANSSIPDSEKALLARCRQAVEKIEPAAEVILGIWGVSLFYISQAMDLYRFWNKCPDRLCRRLKDTAYPVRSLRIKTDKGVEVGRHQ